MESLNYYINFHIIIYLSIYEFFQEFVNYNNAIYVYENRNGPNAKKKIMDFKRNVFFDVVH